MASKTVVQWQFSGNDEAEKASAKSLGIYTSELIALSGRKNGKDQTLPPRKEAPETSPTAEKAVVKAVVSGTGNAYAPSVGLPVAKSAVAKYLNQSLTRKLTEEDVFMTVGCKQAIELAVDILAKPGANILLPRPGFPWDMVRSTYKKLEVKNYGFRRDKRYEIDFESVEKEVDENTFAIFIMNPHNPNGNTYSEAHLKELAELARKLKIMVVSDEIFQWTVYGSNPFVPMGKFSSIVPVITLGSISKGWSVPGWRTGWVALHDLNGVFRSTKIYDAAKAFLEINSKPPTVIQAAIPTILEKTHKEFLEKRRKFLKNKAEIAMSKLKDIPTLKCYMEPEACTFLWTELKIDSFYDIVDCQDFCKKLASEESLIVLPGIAFGLKNWARHSIDMKKSTLEVAFERLKSFCERHTITGKPPLIKEVGGVGGVKDVGSGDAIGGGDGVGSGNGVNGVDGDVDRVKDVNGVN